MMRLLIHKSWEGMANIYIYEYILLDHLLKVGDSTCYARRVIAGRFRVEVEHRWALLGNARARARASVDAAMRLWGRPALAIGPLTTDVSLFVRSPTLAFANTRLGAYIENYDYDPGERPQAQSPSGIDRDSRRHMQTLGARGRNIFPPQGK